MKIKRWLKMYLNSFFILLVFFLFFSLLSYSDLEIVMTQEQFNSLKTIQENLEKKITVLNLALTLLAESPGNVEKLIQNYEKQLTALKKTKDDIQRTLTASIESLNKQIENLTESEERQRQEVEKQLERVKRSEERLIALEKLLTQLKRERLIENITWGAVGVVAGIIATKVAQEIIKLLAGGN